MSDNLKFLLAVALTLSLGVAVVWQSQRREAEGGIGGEPVDLPRIEQLMGSGLLSDHPADYSETMEGR